MDAAYDQTNFAFDVLMIKIILIYPGEHENDKRQMQTTGTGAWLMQNADANADDGQTWQLQVTEIGDRLTRIRMIDATDRYKRHMQTADANARCTQ